MMIHESKFNNDDFDNMGWHDCKIHAIAFNESEFELIFDIDYILEWIKSKNSENFAFKVSPATLIFQNVWDLRINMENNLDIRIEDVYRANPRQPNNQQLEGAMEYDWTIETNNGEVSFKSIGYQQFLRKDFIECKEQSLNFKQRGGISFERDY